MNKKLYVSNLEWGVSDSELREFFSRVGEVVEAVVILDRNTGRSRGFGFVEMKTEDEARKAIEEFEGASLGNRRLMVREANPEPDKKDSGFIGEIKKFVLSSAAPAMGFIANGQHFTITRDEVTVDKNKADLVDVI